MSNAVKKPTYGNAAKPAYGKTPGTASAAGGEKKAVTHSMKNADTKEFVPGSFIRAHDGQYGEYLVLNLTEPLEAGSYFITKRKTDV